MVFTERVVPNTTDITDSASDSELRKISDDLSTELLHEIVLQAYGSHVVTISKFAPSTAPGSEMQIHATEYLRERLYDAGWQVEDNDGVSSISDASNKVRIVCRTAQDSSTGLKSPAGPHLRKVGNGTLRLAGYLGNITSPFPGFEVFANEGGLARTDDFNFYYLLIHIASDHEEIRLELSSPIFSFDGDHLGWKSRLLLPVVSLAHKTDVDIISAPIPDIEVSRKAM